VAYAKVNPWNSETIKATKEENKSYSVNGLKGPLLIRTNSDCDFFSVADFSLQIHFVEFHIQLQILVIRDFREPDDSGKTRQCVYESVPTPWNDIRFNLVNHQTKPQIKTRYGSNSCVHSIN
jgi:hypothetical protein